jgi:DNA-directed RNA polymerase subunit L
MQRRYISDLINPRNSERMKTMQVHVIREGEREFTVEVTGEDYALGEIIHHELLDEKNVTFAGVLPPHPLIKKLVIKIRAQRVKPDRAFIGGLEKAQANTHELLEATNKAFSGGAE